MGWVAVSCAFCKIHCRWISRKQTIENSGISGVAGNRQQFVRRFSEKDDFEGSANAAGSTPVVCRRPAGKILSQQLGKAATATASNKIKTFSSWPREKEIRSLLLVNLLFCFRWNGYSLPFRQIKISNSANKCHQRLISRLPISGNMFLGSQDNKGELVGNGKK